MALQTVAMKFIMKHGKSDKDILNLRQEIEVMDLLSLGNDINMQSSFLILFGIMMRTLSKLPNLLYQVICQVNCCFSESIYGKSLDISLLWNVTDSKKAEA